MDSAPNPPEGSLKCLGLVLCCQAVPDSWEGGRELTASGQHCRETALPRSSSSAKRSRAEGTACRHRGERSEAEKGLKAVRSGGSAEGSKEEKSSGPLTQ